MRRSLTEKILTNPNILFHELPFLWKAYSPKKPFDRDHIKEKIAEMDRYNLQKNLRASLCTGYEVIWDFSFIKEKLSFPVNPKNKPYFELWIDFLHRWGKASGWSGYTGTFGALNLAREISNLHKTLGDSEGYEKCKIALANQYYKLSKSVRKKRDFYLNQGLNIASSIPINKLPPYFKAALYGTLGTLYLSLGDLVAAKTFYQNRLDILDKYNISENSYGNALTDLGYVEIHLVGSRKEGENKIQNGKIICDNYIGFGVRTKRKWAEYWLSKGRTDNEMKEVVKGH